MTRRHYTLVYAGSGLEYQNIVELWVRVRVRNGVRFRVMVRFRVRFGAFSKTNPRIFSRGKMTSCHSGGWK